MMRLVAIGLLALLGGCMDPNDPDARTHCLIPSMCLDIAGNRGDGPGFWGTAAARSILSAPTYQPVFEPEPTRSQTAVSDYDANVARDAATAASRADLERRQATATAQAAEDRAKLTAAEPAAVANYRNCIFGNAGRLAVISDEPAATVARAAYAACHPQRSALVELHKRYGDPGFDDETMNRIEDRVAGALMLTVMRARAARSEPSPVPVAPIPSPAPTPRDESI